MEGGELLTWLGLQACGCVAINQTALKATYIVLNASLDKGIAPYFLTSVRGPSAKETPLDSF